VDFELTTDQVDLRDGFRKLLDGRFPIERVRELTVVDRPRWRELADAGVFALRIPEGADGVGLGMAEGVLVFEELGRALVPGPVLGTELAAQVLPAAAWGAEVIGVLERADGPLLVEHLDSLDRLVVVDDAGLWSVAATELEGEAVERPTDFLTPVHLVPSLPAGEQIGDAGAAARLRLEGTILAAALMVGSAQAVTDLAVTYAKGREQFGRPIAGFQAVKHILADMQVRASVAQVAVHAAGVILDDPSVGDQRRAASTAKVTAGDAAIRNAKAAIQVHGGMGFTWEVDAHLHLKRAWVLDTEFGSADHHADLLAHLL
jgi:alkylation response protein AidB-like acyl-CoA dehydrogenase